MRRHLFKLHLKFLFQTLTKSCKANVISIDTPVKTICSLESGKAGLVLPDAIMKEFAFGDTLDEAHEKFKLPFSITIQSKKNNSAKRKRAEHNEL